MSTIIAGPPHEANASTEPHRHGSRGVEQMWRMWILSLPYVPLDILSALLARKPWQTGQTLDEPGIRVSNMSWLPRRSCDQACRPAGSFHKRHLLQTFQAGWKVGRRIGVLARDGYQHGLHSKLRVGKAGARRALVFELEAQPLLWCPTTSSNFILETSVFITRS